MTAAYYNENDPFAAEWLRKLILFGHIAPGDVDERSIEDVKPDDLQGYDQCHFFAGIGVWSYALRCAGWADDRPVATGSCPCQPFSVSNSVWKRGKGIDDERHLWPHFFRIIKERRFPVVLGEQVASKDGLDWFDAVAADMEGENYFGGAVDLCAAGFGAPHIRQRLYFAWLADAEQTGLERRSRQAVSREGRREEGYGSRRGSARLVWDSPELLRCSDGKTVPVERGTLPLAHGPASRMGVFSGLGNAIVAPVAQGFIEAVMDCAP